MSFLHDALKDLRDICLKTIQRVLLFSVMYESNNFDVHETVCLNFCILIHVGNKLFVQFSVHFTLKSFKHLAKNSEIQPFRTVMVFHTYEYVF